MKKLKFLFAILLLFSSCDNFMDSTLFQQELEEKMDYANAKSHIVFINALEGTGTFMEGGGTKTVKKTDSFDVEFNVNPAYKFIRWIAVDRKDNSKKRDNYIVFADPTSYKTTVTLTGDCDDILIRPECLSYLTITGFAPEYKDTGVEYNSDIKITFPDYLDQSAFAYTKEELTVLGVEEANFLKTTSFDGKEYIYGYVKNNRTFYKNIEITSSTSAANITSFFTPPVIINGNTLLLSLKQERYNDLKAETQNGTAEIKILLSGEIKDRRGMSFAENYANLENSYKINTQIIAETPSVEILFDSEDALGSISPRGKNTIYTQLTYPLEYEPSELYYFEKWGVFYASNGAELPYADKIVEIADDKSTQTSFVLTTAIPGILVKPVCKERSSVLLMSPQGNETNPHASITVTFSHQMNIDDLRWTYDDIKEFQVRSPLRDDQDRIYGYISTDGDHIWQNIEIVSSDGENLLKYFNKPEFILNNTQLKIEAEPSLTIPGGTIVIVRINKAIRDIDGIPCGKAGTYIEFNYLVQ